MRLYIIGNGFDIAHGLPTRYWDFRKYIEKTDELFLTSFEQHYNIYPGMSDEAKKRILWNEFETNLANIDEDVIIDRAISVEMDLESGDMGIEDTLYSYFSDEYQYIQKLAVYLKRWIRTIRIRDALPKVSEINPSCDLFVNFNYTATLEHAYWVRDSSVIHIHGSLREYTVDPVLGHGNKQRMAIIKQKRKEAEKYFDEKELSICKVLDDYYQTTFKNVGRYIHCLDRIAKETISEIVVAGHSLAGIDMPYLSRIDELTCKCKNWKIVWFDCNKVDVMKQNLIACGIDEERVIMVPSTDFYDLTEEEAKRKQVEWKYGF